MRRPLRTALAALAAGAALVGAALAEPAITPTAAPAGTTSGAAWGANYFPNVMLTTQEGRPVRFYEDLVKGKIILVNFMFTNCSDVCPAETAALRQVYELLGDRMGRDVFMYSISVDPEHDTPKVLKAYRDSFQIGAGWTFLTASRADTTLLQQRLGMRPVVPGALSEHGTSIMLGSEPMGRWIRRTVFDNPVVLANIVNERLSTQRSEVSVKSAAVSYADAERFPEMTRGEDLFRSRCASCHTLGLGDRIGPDLRNVAASRDRAWLTRWIKEPDKMLREGDPVATAMLARYRGVRMPNLRLNDVDANALIAFLEHEDAEANAAAAQARRAAGSQATPTNMPGMDHSHHHHDGAK